MEYIKHPNGIHEFLWDEAKVEIVEEWIEKLEEIYTDSPPESTLLFLIDSPVTMPTASTYHLVRNFRANQTVRHFTRTAVLYETRMSHKEIKQMEDMFNREEDVYRVFNPEKRKEAIGWLLA